MVHAIQKAAGIRAPERTFRFGALDIAIGGRVRWLYLSACLSVTVLSAACGYWGWFVPISLLMAAFGFVRIHPGNNFDEWRLFHGAVLVMMLAALSTFGGGCAPPDVYAGVMTFAICAMAYGISAAVSGRGCTGAMVLAALLFLTGLAAYFVIFFRGSVVVAQDIANIGSAIGVSQWYEPVLDDVVLTGACMLLAVWWWAYAFDLPAFRIGARSRALISCVCTTGLLVACLSCARLFEADYWGIGDNGFLVNFMATAFPKPVQEPDGFEDVGALLDSLLEEYPSDAAVSDDLPSNVIVIMNESFSTLGLEIDDTDACMPYLADRADVGFAYPSVFGGTTVNSEYEFLTGNTMRYLEPGSVAYREGLGGLSYTLAEQMSDLGYDPVAVHPYASAIWGRSQAYPEIGFFEFVSADTQGAFDGLDGYVRRQMLSDEALYGYLFDRVSGNIESGRREFLFTVTIQNHGDFLDSFDGVLEGPENEVDIYRDLMRESDRAFAAFLSELEALDEDVLVLFFGDHAPNFLYHDFTEALDPDGYEFWFYLEIRKTPYLVWHNHGRLDPDFIPEPMSLNYLSGTMLESAGMPMTGYQKFLSDLHGYMPVVNLVGVEGDASWEDLYRLVQYANVYGSEEVRGHPFFRLADE